VTKSHHPTFNFKGAIEGGYVYRSSIALKPAPLTTMIDTDNLRTASLYINNQLLSRGLLRDGQSIDFAGVAFDGHEAAATMGRIVSVLNDLILRRDVRCPLLVLVSN
jgi:hypothetical protein